MIHVVFLSPCQSFSSLNQLSVQFIYDRRIFSLLFKLVFLFFQLMLLIIQDSAAYSTKFRFFLSQVPLLTSFKSIFVSGSKLELLRERICCFLDSTSNANLACSLKLMLIKLLKLHLCFVDQSLESVVTVGPSFRDIYLVVHHDFTRLGIGSNLLRFLYFIPPIRSYFLVHTLVYLFICFVFI